MSSSNAPESASVEAGPRSAVVIPFPSRRNQEPGPEDRLTKALASLNAALAEQKIAIAAWRGALGELKQTTTGLSESLHRYRDSLGTLSNRVAALHTQARSMEQWADGVLGQ